MDALIFSEPRVRPFVEGDNQSLFPPESKVFLIRRGSDLVAVKEGGGGVLIPDMVRDYFLIIS